LIGRSTRVIYSISDQRTDDRNQKQEVRRQRRDGRVGKPLTRNPQRVTRSPHP